MVIAALEKLLYASLGGRASFYGRLHEIGRPSNSLTLIKFQAEPRIDGPAMKGADDECMRSIPGPNLL